MQLEYKQKKLIFDYAIVVGDAVCFNLYSASAELNSFVGKELTSLYNQNKCHFTNVFSFLVKSYLLGLIENNIIIESSPDCWCLNMDRFQKITTTGGKI